MTSSTYTVPDSPADPEAAALELIVRLPSSLSDRLTEAAFIVGLSERDLEACRAVGKPAANRRASACFSRYAAQANRRNLCL
jgi:hypothetical protein